MPHTPAACRARVHACGRVIVSLVASASLVSCSSGAETSHSSRVDQQPGSGPRFSCVGSAPSRVLPKWVARAGFSGPDPRAPYILGAKHRIAAVLFGQPFTVPPREGHNNKILWVARRPPEGVTTLKIHASLAGGGLVVSRDVPGGPGPSVVDLPKAGCWHFTLEWGHQRDNINLKYRAAGAG